MNKLVLCPNCQSLNRVPLKSEGNGQCGRCSNTLPDKNMVSEYSQEKLTKALAISELPIVVDVFADWCGPCRSYGPIFKEVANTEGERYLFVKIDSEKAQEFCMRYQVRSLPSTLIFKGGTLAVSQPGLLSPDQLKSILYRVKPEATA